MDEATEKLLRLLDQYGTRLHALLMKLTLRRDAAEELLQELFLRLSRSDGFRQCPAPERYLFRSAVNLAFDWRKQQQRSAAARGLVDDDAIEWATPMAEAIRREEVERVLSAMDRLSSSHRELITLRYLHSLSYDELAAHFNTTPHRVRGLCSKALARLRRLTDADQSADEPKKLPYDR